MKYKDMTEAETLRQLEWSDHHEFSYDYAMWSFKKLKEYKEVIDKIKEYAGELRLFDNESVEFEISSKILELLEEINE